MTPRVRRSALLATAGGVALVAGAWLWGGYRPPDDRLPPGEYEPIDAPHWEVAAGEAQAIREEALARARVWQEPPEAIESVDFSRNPGDDAPLDPGVPISCRFLPRAVSGTTPKFDCVLSGGQVIKVKYGGTPETHAEVAASRLMAALGFGADRMDLVARLRCFGCPPSPFRTYQALELARLDGAYTRRIDYTRYRDFAWPAVERRFRAASIDTTDVEGWGFYELTKIDPARGGSPRAHVDALRLLAVFLHHWDNKAENQRLVCLSPPADGANGPCPRPFALLQDLGSTFGPNKVQLESWQARPVWSDAATCAVDMKDMPYGGATFRSAVISEAGRVFLADRLKRLSEAQVRALFVAARFPEHHSGKGAGGDHGSWVRAFQAKVREIADRAPCPS